MSNSLQPHGPHHARLPCPSPTPRALSNSCPLCSGCHPTISSSVIPFSTHLQSFPASAPFKMRQFFPSGGQGIGSFSFSISISPSNEYSGLISFRMNCLDLLAVQRTLESSPTPQFRSINSLALSFLYSPTFTSIHDYWKNHSFARWTFVDKVMSLLFNMLSRLVITFLPRSKRLLISWLESPSALILEPQKIKYVTIPLFPHLFAMK